MTDFADRLRIILGLDPRDFEKGAKNAEEKAKNLAESLKKAFNDATVTSMKGEIDRLLISTGSLTKNFRNLVEIVTKTQKFTEFSSAIGEAGLTGALGELAPFAVSNPIAAIVVTISALAILSILSYTEKIREMKNEAKALQEIIKNGIKKVNNECANIIKSMPSILKNNKIKGLASLPYNTLTKAQKKQVDEFNKVLIQYNAKTKQKRISPIVSAMIGDIVFKSLLFI